VIYPNDEEFVIGGCKVLRQSEHDAVCVVAAGITLHEVLKAYDFLLVQKNPISIRVIDLYSVKPLDVDTLIRCAIESGKKVVTVEDHYAEGGIGEAVATLLCNYGVQVEVLAVRRLPRSGLLHELLAYSGIDAEAVVAKVQEMCAEN